MSSVNVSTSIFTNSSDANATAVCSDIFPAEASQQTSFAAIVGGSLVLVAVACLFNSVRTVRVMKLRVSLINLKKKRDDAILATLACMLLVISEAGSRADRMVCRTVGLTTSELANNRLA